MQVLAPLKHREFRAAWLGQTINIAGDAIYGVAITMFLLPRPDAARAIGFVLAFTALGSVVSVLLGGVLADRHRRSRLILASDAVRFTALLTMVVLGPRAPLGILLLAGLVMGVGLGLYRPAYGALLPSLIPADLIPAANALRSIANRVAAIVGAALAGLLIAVTSAQTTLVIDLATFVVSMATLIVIRDTPPRAAGRAETMWQDLRAGLAYVRARPWMSAVMIQGAVQLAMVSGPVFILLPLVLGDRSAQTYGFAIAAEAAGSVVGAMLAGSWRPRSPGYAAMLCLLAQLPQLIALALDLPGAAVVALSFLAGAGMAAFAVLWLSALQTSTPRDKLGRVMSVDSLANTSFTPVGLALAGWLFPVIGQTALAALAAVTLVVSVLAVLPIPGVARLAGAGTSVGLLPKEVR